MLGDCMALEKNEEDLNLSPTSEIVNFDCLDFLSNYAGPKFNLVYLDPPYFLDRTFSLEAASNDISFQGGWENQEVDQFCLQIGGRSGNEALVRYLSWLSPRLKLVREHMSNTGSIFLHIGTREGPYVSLLLDDIFGMKQWRSTITWQRSHPHNNMKISLGNVSDYIYYYSVSENYTFNLLHTPHDEVYLANSFSNEDDNGPYALAPIIQEKSRRGHFYEYNGVTPPYGWRVKIETLKSLDADGRVHWGKNRAYKKVYLEEAKGAALQNIWSDIHNITRTEIDNRKYPTQKPIKLLERIIQIASNPGDIVFDPFCGSGTTLVAAKKHGRIPLGSDISPEAVEIARKRLSSVVNGSESTLF